MTTKEAYLHFGKGDEPRQTVQVPFRETEQPAKGRYNLTGYGPQIPTRYMIQWEGRWRRVYVANYGNAGTAYIGKPGNWLATVDID